MATSPFSVPYLTVSAESKLFTLFLSREAFCPSLGTYAFVPQAVGRAKIKLLEPVISPVLLPEETHMHPQPY